MSQSPTLDSKERVIRVFVSSTFRDMQAERDELVLRIFPQLRRLCEERGVTWGEVDLRWGITEEQAERGEVLPICLAEIKRCRPYFIGLLGERYGWIPDAIPQQVLDREPWIARYSDGNDRKSVTELEILHGVLNNPEMANHAFFYFRDPKYIATVPADHLNDFASEDDERAAKLLRLKDTIRQAYRRGELKRLPSENYRDAKALGEHVLADFTALINRLYPLGQQPSPLAQEQMDHEAFARSRASVYIGRQEYFDRIVTHATGDGPPLVVLGESGSGKSALLANWGIKYREEHPEDHVLLHFIGSSPDSINVTGLLRRVMLELKQHFELPDELPAQPDELREAFPLWLASAAMRGRVILILDALNQLEDVNAAHDLGWLPRVFPRNCRVIVSTLPGRCFEAIVRRNWLDDVPPLDVKPLDESERRQLIRDFLSQHTRDLGDQRTSRIVSAPQTANPLYLRVLLDELRVFGVHEELNARIDWYLEAQDPFELYEKVIIRWEEAYEGDSDLVGDVLSLIWAARRGLSEAELLEALGNAGRPLPHAVWSPLRLAMADSLISRGGLLTFAHDYLRSAVREAYLPSTAHQDAAHLRVAEFFDQQTHWTRRRLDELPWQLAAAQEWSRLHDVLTRRLCFIGLQQTNDYELLDYWLQLTGRYDVAASYSAAFARWEREQPEESQVSQFASLLASFLSERAACHTAAEALMLRSLQIDESRLGRDHPEIARHLNNLAMLFRWTNKLDEAVTLMRRALAIDEQALGVEHPNVALSLANLAALLHSMNRMEEAEPLMRRALSIDEKQFGSAHPDVARDLNNLAELLESTDRLAEAEQLFCRALAIDEQSYGYQHPEVATDLRNLGTLLYSMGRMSEAEPLMRRALAIDERAFGPSHPNVAIAMNNLAVLLDSTNQVVEAESLARQALAIDLGSFGECHPSVARDLNNLGQLLKKVNRLSEAEPLLRRALAIDEKAYGVQHENVTVVLYNLVALLLSMERVSEAEQLMLRVLEILLRLTAESEQPHPDLHVSLRNYSEILQMMGTPPVEIRHRLIALFAEYGLCLR